MRVKELATGRHYEARVSGVLTTVLLLDVYQTVGLRKTAWRCRVRNLRTGRILTVHPSRLRREVQP